MAAVTMDLSGLAGWAAMKDRRAADIARPLRVCEQLTISAVKQGFSRSADPDGNPWRPISFRIRGSGKPLYDTGKLASSIRSVVSGNSLSVGTNLQYAGIHQFGGVITPKRGQWLTIPLTVEAMRSGGPRRQKGLHRRGRALFDRQGRIQWALVKSVTIPARRFLGFGSKLVEQIRGVFVKHLQG